MNKPELTKREYFAFEFAKEYLKIQAVFDNIASIAVELTDQLIKELEKNEKT